MRCYVTRESVGRTGHVIEAGLPGLVSPSRPAVLIRPWEGGGGWCRANR